MSTYVSGSFPDVERADAALDRLLALGYDKNDINVAMNSDVRNRYFNGDAHDNGSEAAKGAAGGGMIGATLGAIIGAATLSGAVTLTVATGGLAAPFLAGPLVAALAGGGAGAAAGSVIGALALAGGNSAGTEEIEREIAAGNVVVSLMAHDQDVAQVREILGADRTPVPERAPSDFTSGVSDGYTEGRVNNAAVAPSGGAPIATTVGAIHNPGESSMADLESDRPLH